MSHVNSLLKSAMASGADPRKISPQSTWFAWRPVRLQNGKWTWLRKVERFRPLGMFNEYYEINR